MMNLRIDWKEVQRFFFRAMVEGWAAKGSKAEPPDMPGYKEIYFQEGDFQLVDLWCAISGQTRSAGTTTIWIGQRPIWVMQYGGWYRPEAIPTVRGALLSAYKGEIFMGGRGSITFSLPESPHLEYRNRVNMNDLFQFSGTEYVWDKRGNQEKKIGLHYYSGMALVDR